MEKRDNIYSKRNKNNKKYIHNGYFPKYVMNIYFILLRWDFEDVGGGARNPRGAQSDRYAVGVCPFLHFITLQVLDNIDDVFRWGAYAELRIDTYPLGTHNKQIFKSYQNVYSSIILFFFFFFTPFDASIKSKGWLHGNLFFKGYLFRIFPLAFE